MSVSFHRLVSRLKLRHLVLMRALGEVASLQEAAAKVGISQPTASTRLREVEDAVGVKLFDRHPHGITPNAFGDKLILWSRIILTDLQRARHDLEAVAASKSGKIRVGVTAVIAPELMTGSLIELRKRHSGLLVYIELGHDSSLLPKLQNGELDLVITRLVPESIRGGHHHEVLYKDTTVVVTRASHPLAIMGPITAEGLNSHEWILPEEGSQSREVVSRSLISLGAAPPRVVVETPSRLLVYDLLLTSNLISIMPGRIAASYLNQGLLARLPISLHGADEPVVAVMRHATGDDFQERRDLIQTIREMAARQPT